MEDIFSQTFPAAVGNKLEKLQLYFETGLYDEAAALLDELIAQFPDEERFVYLRAIVDYQKKDYVRAGNVLAEFSAQYPQIPEPYYLLSEISLQRGDLAAAKEYLAKYCALAPEDFAARQRLGTFTNNPVFASAGIIIKEGRQYPAVVQRIGFYGACIYSPSPDAIKLINGRHRNWSSMGIDFVSPVDLRGKTIVLNLRGRSGGEKLELTFRDKFAQDYNPQLVITPCESLGRDWQKIAVNLDGAGSKIDLSCITHMGLEFGFSTVQNPPNSALFIRDVLIENTHN